jgi:uncharacterized protein (UPF0333 family)
MSLRAYRLLLAAVLVQTATIAVQAYFLSAAHEQTAAAISAGNDAITAVEEWKSAAETFQRIALKWRKEIDSCELVLDSMNGRPN